MIRFGKTSNGYWRRVLTSTAIMIVTVAVIVFFLPRNSGPQFRYDVGKPWMYGSLIAKFDFPIYKTEETIKEEQDSIADAFEPYYNYDAKVEKEQIARFTAKYKDGIPGVTPDYVATIADRLHRLYQAGIMNAPEYSEISRDTMKMVRVVNGKKAANIEIMCMYSTMTAYEKLFSDPKIAAQKQALQRCNLNEYIQPNLRYDEERSETELGDMLSGIPLASGMVLSGQKIIDRGEIVDDHTYRVLNSFERETKRRSASVSAVPSTIAGQALFVATLILLFTTYLRLFRKDYFEKTRSISMLYVMITIFPLLVSLMVSHNVLSVYILPFAIAPIFIRVFLDSRTAFTAHVTMVLICAAAVKYQYEFIIVQLVAGLIAIYSLRELSQRAEIFKTALLVTAGTCGIYFALQADAGQQHPHHGPQHVQVLRGQRRAAALRLSADARHRKDLRVHIQRDAHRAVKHKQETAAQSQRGGSRHVPTLRNGGQPCSRNSQQNRREGPALYARAHSTTT